MYEGFATLFVDLGNSETRVKVKSASFDSPVVTFSNQFSRVPEDYVAPESYAGFSESGQFSSILRIGDQRYAHGPLALKEFEPTLMKPTATIPKFRTDCTSRTLHRALLEGYRLLAEAFKVELSGLDITWDIVLLSPPIHVDQADKFEELVRSVDALRVEFPYELTLPITVKDVKVLPEGIAAFFALAFNDDRTPRKGLADHNIKDSSILVMDVGAGTTDVCVIDKLRAIMSTRDTFPVGGNNVYQQVGKSLKTSGYDFSESSVILGTHSGSLKDGSKVLDIRKLIESVKSNIAMALSSQIRRSFEANMYNPRGLEYLVVIGGGALTGATTSLGEHLLEQVREFAPNIALLEVPEGLNLRHMNILGASTLVSGSK